MLGALLKWSIRRAGRPEFGEGDSARPGGRVRAGVAVVALVVAASCSSTSDDSRRDSGGSAPTTTQAARTIAERTSDLSEAVRAWWAYERAPKYSSVTNTVGVAMSDGVKLNCRLTRPARDGVAVDGKFPGLVIDFTPYEVLAATTDQPAFFAARGYNALVCTLRGTGSSEGTWQGGMSDQDGKDAAALVEWLAVQPFSDGRIGQMGESYGGQTSYGSAMEQPKHLLAIAPLQPPNDLYHEIIFPGGIKATEGGLIDSWPPIGNQLSGGRIDVAAEYAANRPHTTYDDFWKTHSYRDGFDRVKVPVLTVGGWDDHFFRVGTLTNLESLTTDVWTIYGQWDHFPPIAFSNPCALCVPMPLPSGVALAWFDHWVMQLDNVPVPARPVFVSEEGPRRGDTQVWKQVDWSTTADGPAWQLGADGSLGETAPSGEVTFSEPADPLTAGGAATFTSAALASDRVLLGHSQLDFTATASGTDAQFYVELVDVDPSGNETVVNDGFLKASHRESHEDPTPIVAGQPTQYRIAVGADHYRFGTGHRVRLRISGGAANRLVPIDPAVNVTIATGRSATFTFPAGW